MNYISIPNRRGHAVRSALLLLCSLIILAASGFLICGVRINSEPPVVREYVLEEEKISSPVTVVFLSDLHGCEHPTLIDRVEEIGPDLILLGGDMINHMHETGEDILVTAAAIAGAFFFCHSSNPRNARTQPSHASTQTITGRFMIRKDWFLSAPRNLEMPA